MKRIFVAAVFWLIPVLLSACGEMGEDGKSELTLMEPVKMEEGMEDGESSPESARDGAEPDMHQEPGGGMESGVEPAMRQETEDGAESGVESDMHQETGDRRESGAESAGYEGEYGSTELDTYRLTVKKEPDGSYRLRIHLFWLTKLYDCVGYESDDGIGFSTGEWGEGREISGTVQFEGDMATVTFTQGWDVYSFGDKASYQYTKISDTPDMGGDRPDIDLGSFEGEYNDHDNDEPNLEIRLNEDGSYLIQIGIFRLLYLDGCVGRESGGVIAFTDSVTGVQGTIGLEGDVATVTFGDGFPYGEIKVYRYYKTSDVPNIQP